MNIEDMEHEIKELKYTVNQRHARDIRKLEENVAGLERRISDLESDLRTAQNDIQYMERSAAA